MTEQGGMLVSNRKGGTLRDFVLMINEETKDAWRGASTKVMQSVKAGGFEAHFGEDWWSWHSKHPEKKAQFDRAMTQVSVGAAGAVLSEWRPPSDDIMLCDIGGGV